MAIRRSVLSDLLNPIESRCCDNQSLPVGERWGVPAFIKVDMNTKFLPSNNLFIDGSLNLLSLLL